MNCKTSRVFRAFE